MPYYLFLVWVCIAAVLYHTGTAQRLPKKEGRGGEVKEKRYHYHYLRVQLALHYSNTCNVYLVLMSRQTQRFPRSSTRGHL